MARSSTKRAVAVAPIVAGAAITAYDLIQRKHAILRNFPVIGHLRYLLEKVGPELRQYIVTGNDEERPFSRDQRRWIYASAKRENNYFGFGTDDDIERTPGYPIIKHRTLSAVGPHTGVHAGEDVVLPSAKVLGAARQRPRAFRPQSIVNVSGMSFGSLSAAAVTALNRGVAKAGCLQDTGEGGLSPYHRSGGDLVFQIGTGYFGCRDAQGRFDLQRLVDLVASAPVRAIEIKLSQGAKPGLGGLLPGAKVTQEIADIRGIPVGVDCASPSRHAVFSTVDEMLDFTETVAAATGVPVGIKSAVGDTEFWDELVQAMIPGDRGVDFVVVDGGEGGTGAAPLVFTDSVSLPFRLGFPRVFRAFAEAGIDDRVTFIGSGKLGLPENAIVALALGCDMVNVGREAMMAIGCVQAQRCHTDHCPTGVATQNRWLQRGLDPTDKAERLADYVRALRRDLLKVSEACGVPHPALIPLDAIEILDGQSKAVPAPEVYGYRPGWGLPAADQISDLLAVLAHDGGEDSTTQHTG